MMQMGGAGGMMMGAGARGRARRRQGTASNNKINANRPGLLPEKAYDTSVRVTLHCKALDYNVPKKSKDEENGGETSEATALQEGDNANGGMP